MRIITIDPGDHIGIVYTEDDKLVRGRTIVGDDRNMQLYELLKAFKPDAIVYETFALRPGMGTKLAGNKFITCEVIGVIKLYAQCNNIELIDQLPGTKEYCGFSRDPRDPHYSSIEVDDPKITEHVRDAYRLYSYYKLFGSRLNKNTRT